MSGKQGRRTKGEILFHPEQHYSCLNCGKCCRIWDVPVSLAEKNSICKLPFETRNGRPEDCFVEDSKRRGVFLIRKFDLRCAFLDTDNLCVIHKKFGEKVKPLACRIYPFDIFNWDDGAISASLRFDCPSVSASEGKKIAEYKSQILSFSKEISAAGKIAEVKYSRQINNCEIQKLRTIAGAYRRVILDKGMPPTYRVFACAELLAFHSRKENSHDIIFADESFESDAIALIQRSIHEIENKVSAARILDVRRRILFRYLVNGYVRTDEAARFGNSVLGRVRRTRLLLTFCLGKGSLSDFISGEPRVSSSDPVEALDIFRKKSQKTPDIYWDYLASKLDSLHFCGYPVFGHSFEEGMRHLLLTYPVVSCIAIMLAGKDACEQKMRASFQQALMLVDHTFSRSPFFKLSKVKSIEREFCVPEVFASLLPNPIDA